MTNATDAGTTLRVSRTYPVARERVFAAWLDAATLRRFFCPRDVTIDAVTTDPRTGGAYSVVMNTAQGPWTVRGTYIEITPPERIVFTWAWDEDDPADAHESLVTVDFHDRGGATELVLTHERLRDTGSRDGHRDGWISVLENLDGALS